MKHTLLIYLLLFLHMVALAQNEKPALSDSDSWTMVIVPDPQSYVKFARNQGTLELMTAWITENINALNIEMVLCTGDLVEQNEMLVLDPVNGNQTSKRQWEAVSKAFGRFDGRVPYILAAGNHDFGYKNVETRHSNYNKYFPSHKNFKNEELLREVGKNTGALPSTENAAYEFISPHGRKFLILNLEFAPRNTTIDWASHVMNKSKYKDHTGIVLTHSYLDYEGNRIVKENYPIEDANYGQAIWDKLVKPAQNIELVISGHIGASNDFRKHVGFSTAQNSAGKKVNQMVFNAQALGGGWHGNGGDGWIRLLEFLPDGKTVKVRTFSPYFFASPSTKHLAWSKEGYNEFSFDLAISKK